MRPRTRKIAVFSGSRAEYGLLSPVIKALCAEPQIECQLILSGSHLDSAEPSEAALDGYAVAASVKQTVITSDLASTAVSIGELVSALARELKKLSPELLLVYGDRSEAFSAAIAASQMGIALAHLEAGDRTDGGCLDDSVRHAISKLSHIFFTTNAEATSRIRQLGEEPWRIHNVGLTTLDLIKSGEYYSIAELKDEFGFNTQNKLILFTQHSVALQLDQIEQQIEQSILALKSWKERGAQVMITAANADAGGERINVALKNFAKDGQSIRFVPTLGRRRYHGFLGWCGSSQTAGGVCVGNSSSGLKEAVAFGCPAINIGQRQLGRLAPANVIHVAHDKAEICNAIDQALSNQDFREKCRSCANPYGNGNAGISISKILAEVSIAKLLSKKFCDLLV
jgi:UDP-hydrolysing UDP-N-acetyl-D-glucosamine 2-epimerase